MRQSVGTAATADVRAARVLRQRTAAQAAQGTGDFGRHVRRRGGEVHAAGDRSMREDSGGGLREGSHSDDVRAHYVAGAVQTGCATDAQLSRVP